MLRVEHTACPVAFRLLAGSHGFGHRLEAVYVLLAVLVCFGQVFQYLCQGSQHPTVATAVKYPELNRKVPEYAYEKLVDYAISLGVMQAFIQEGDTAKESFIPPFTLEGV